MKYQRTTIGDGVGAAGVLLIAHESGAIDTESYHD